MLQPTSQAHMPDKDIFKNIHGLTIDAFIRKTANSKPEITGGAVILTTARMGLALILLSLEISYKKTREKSIKENIKEKISLLRSLEQKLADAAEVDLQIFNEVRNRPGSMRRQALGSEYLELLKQSINSPLEASGAVSDIIKVAGNCSAYCKKTVISDLNAGLMILSSAFQSLLLLASSNIRSLPLTERKHYKELLLRISQEKIERLIPDRL